MVGARAGDRVLVIGSADPGLAAALSQVTALTGEVRVVDHAPGAAQQVANAAARAGVLVEFDEAPPTRLPFDQGTFDIAVINRRLSSLAEPDRTPCVGEALRILRPGGRLVAIDALPRTGFFSLLTPSRTTVTADALRDMLMRGGCRATRVLGEAEGIIYLEAAAPRDQVRS
ncbi:MAG TPA: methyltransferase domain-containing protein [Vicinamibacterales bacterium]|nr:methyltransferase domain-containing protein [Vicinamibacterales bacterium]